MLTKRIAFWGLAMLLAIAGLVGERATAQPCEPGWVPTFGQLPGVNDLVLALTVFDDGLGAGAAQYAGGIFNTAGGANANRIARWDGPNWSRASTTDALATGRRRILVRSTGPEARGGTICNHRCQKDSAACPAARASPGWWLR